MITERIVGEFMEFTMSNVGKSAGKVFKMAASSNMDPATKGISLDIWVRSTPRDPRMDTASPSGSEPNSQLKG